MYFDGFAGSGDIYQDNNTDLNVIKGAAIQVLGINDPKSFDTYYFVEKDENNKIGLDEAIGNLFPHKNTFVVCEDCNVKLKSMAVYLDKNKDFRALAFIDPYGMALEWKSLEVLKGLGIDLWILVPTGIGVNRLLKVNGEISDAWLKRLEKFLGLERKAIIAYFYKTITTQTLFGEETASVKEDHAITKAGTLYKQRLNEVFDFVSEPFPLKNSTGSIMYHFMMATNNKVALKIANDIIKTNYGTIQY